MATELVDIQSSPMRWLLITAALTTLISLAEAWFATFIVYGKSKTLKRLFPAVQNLIRSHIDYLLMTFLLTAIYFICSHLTIALPSMIIFLLCLGALYNPFGFLIKAIKPRAGSDLDLVGKMCLYIGFLPITIGAGYPMILIALKLL